MWSVQAEKENRHKSLSYVRNESFLTAILSHMAWTVLMVLSSAKSLSPHTHWPHLSGVMVLGYHAIMVLIFVWML